MTSDERWNDMHPKSSLARLAWATPLAFVAGVLIGVVLL